MDVFLQGFATVLQPQYLLFMFGGVALGLFIGFLPGLSGGMGIGLMLPFTFHMEPLTALVFLCSIYTGGIFGGAVTAILLNTPGEMFFVAIFGLTVVGSLSDNVIKGVFSGLFGILLGIVGLSANGVSRGTMGILYLMDGIPTIPALLGLLALPAIYELSGRKSAVLKVNTVSSGFASLRGLLQGFQDTLRRGVQAVQGHPMHPESHAGPGGVFALSSCPGGTEEEKDPDCRRGPRRSGGRLRPGPPGAEAGCDGREAPARRPYRHRSRSALEGQYEPHY